jgi:hypothetical protein
MVAAFSDVSSNIKAPVLGGSNLCSIKTNFINLIHQADLMVNGKTIESTQPFINVARHFQLLRACPSRNKKILNLNLTYCTSVN